MGLRRWWRRQHQPQQAGTPCGIDLGDNTASRQDMIAKLEAHGSVRTDAARVVDVLAGEHHESSE